MGQVGADDLGSHQAAAAVALVLSDCSLDPGLAGNAVPADISLASDMFVALHIAQAE
jgi:hypothetical protein